MGRLRLPDLFTLGNLLSGLIALVYAYQRAWGPMLVAMAVGALCDVVDGALARLLRSPSALGKELDSLADLVTFGVVPAFALYHYIKPLLADLPYHPEARYVMVLVPFSLPLMAAWRLARFNVEREAEGNPFFSGMPTPFQGLFWAVWVYAEPRGLWLHPLVWSGLVVLIGLLMVSRWPFLSLKKPLLVLPGLAGVILWTGLSLYLFPLTAAIPLSALGYVLLSGGAYGWMRWKKRPLQDSNLRPSG